MTLNELIDVVGKKRKDKIYYGLKEAKKINPKLNELKKHDNVVPNYSKDEVNLILLCAGMNFIQRELILECFDEVSKGGNLRYTRVKSLYLDGTENFIERCKKNKTCKACANCLFLVGKTIRTFSIRERPFCDFYKKFIHNMSVEKNHKMVQANIFVDRCNSWKKSEPHLFLKN